MKKLLHISFTFFLAVVLVIMGSGVTFLHCSCSGKTTVILSHTAQNGGNSNTTKGCMKVTSVQLSPTTQMQPTVFGFHAFLPLMAIIHEWQMPHLSFMAKRTLSNTIPKTGYSPPPKLYLYLIEVLTIWTSILSTWWRLAPTMRINLIRNKIIR